MFRASKLEKAGGELAPEQRHDHQRPARSGNAERVARSLQQQSSLTRSIQSSYVTDLTAVRKWFGWRVLLQVKPV